MTELRECCTNRYWSAFSSTIHLNNDTLMLLKYCYIVNRDIRAYKGHKYIISWFSKGIVHKEASKATTEEIKMRLNKNLCQVNKHFNINSRNNKKSRLYIGNLKAFSFCDFNIKQSSVIQTA